MEKEKLKLVSALALEYRLSLKNMCKILGLSTTGEEQNNLKEEILKMFEDKNAINFLIYETSNESSNASKSAYNLASLVWSNIAIALKSKDSKKIKSASKYLYDIDQKFMKLLEKENWLSLTKEEFLIIAKYRVKYAMKIDDISSILKISRNTIINNEKLITNEKWKKRIEDLSTFNSSLHSASYSRQKIKKW